MRRYLCMAIMLNLFAISACTVEDAGQAGPYGQVIESVHTDIGASACVEKIDPEDPDEASFQLCPGVSGYTLIVRLVGSGRQSVDVLTPAGDTYPLDYHEYVTRHMLQLGDRAEWRVVAIEGKKTPVALLVDVLAHEDPDEPQDVTHTYRAIAKITPTGACVTDRIEEHTLSQGKVDGLADTAADRDCLAVLPEWP